MDKVSSASMQVVIVDDEPLARHKIRSLLELDDDVEILGEARDARSAVKLIDELKPNLVFLDIRMPDGSGIDVLRDIKHDHAVILTTAFGSYAVAAFEIGVVDYLVKPFSRQRFAKALARTRELRRADPASKPTAARVLINTRAGTICIEAADIEYLRGEGDYAQVFTAEKNYLAPIRLKEFEEKLDPDQFVRIHRSHIVNIDAIAVVRSLGNGRCSVELKRGLEICASRAGTAQLRDRMQRVGKYLQSR